MPSIEKVYLARHRNLSDLPSDHLINYSALPDKLSQSKAPTYYSLYIIFCFRLQDKESDSSGFQHTIDTLSNENTNLNHQLAKLNEDLENAHEDLKS